MKYLPRDIRQMKLVTGDELLTEVIGEDHVEFLIRNPLKVFKEKITYNGLSREANFFTRWMGFADNQEFILNKSHIVAEGLVDDQVADYYNKMMANIEQDDTIHFGNKSEAENPEFLEQEEPDLDITLDNEDTDKPTYH